MFLCSSRCAYIFGNTKPPVQWVLVLYMYGVLRGREDEVRSFMPGALPPYKCHG